MLRNQYFILADDVRMSLNGTFDIMGVFDRVHAPAVPAVHPRLALVVQLVTDDEDGLGKHQFSLAIRTPSGRTLLQQDGTMQVKPEAGSWVGSVRLVLQFQGFPLPEYGKYDFSLSVDGKPTGSHPLTVIRPPSPPAPGTA